MIRTATPADVPDIVDLGVRHWSGAHYGQWMAADRHSMATLARSLIDMAIGLVLVDEQGGGLTGGIGLIITPHIYSGLPVATELFWYVAPEARGPGVRLLKKAEAWAREAGVTLIAMTAPDERVATFLGRMGYAPLETNFIKTL